MRTGGFVIHKLLEKVAREEILRSRRSPDLIRKSITLFYWKLFRCFEDFLLKFKYQLVNPQVLEARYPFRHCYGILLFCTLLFFHVFRLCHPSSVICRLSSVVISPRSTLVFRPTAASVGETCSG